MHATGTSRLASTQKKAAGRLPDRFRDTKLDTASVMPPATQAKEGQQ